MSYMPYSVVHDPGTIPLKLSVDYATGKALRVATILTIVTGTKYRWVSLQLCQVKQALAPTSRVIVFDISLDGPAPNPHLFSLTVIDRDRSATV